MSPSVTSNLCCCCSLHLLSNWPSTNRCQGRAPRGECRTKQSLCCSGPQSSTDYHSAQSRRNPWEGYLRPPLRKHGAESAERRIGRKECWFPHPMKGTELRPNTHWRRKPEYCSPAPHSR